MKVVRRVIAVLATAALVATTGCANSSESGQGEKVKIAVGGLTNLHNVPLVLADELGLFEKAGADVELIDSQSGSKALEALLSDSAQMTAGFYDHTLQSQAKNKDLTSFAVLSTLPGAVLAVSPKHAGEISSVADLRGRPVGVTSPGSSSDFFLQQLLKKNGMSKSDVGVVAIGSGSSAVAAMEQGKVEAAFMFDPAYSQLKQRAPQVKTLVDMRTADGTKTVLGKPLYPSEVLYTTPDWLKENEETAKAVAKAVTDALAWVADHSAAEIADKMPAEFVGNDKELYVEILGHALPMFSKDGRMPAGGPQVNVSLLEQSLGLKGLEPDRTYTNTYVQQST